MVPHGPILAMTCKVAKPWIGFDNGSGNGSLTPFSVETELQPGGVKIQKNIITLISRENIRYNVTHYTLQNDWYLKFTKFAKQYFRTDLGFHSGGFRKFGK